MYGDDAGLGDAGADLAAAQDGAALHTDEAAAMLQVAQALVAFGVIQAVPTALTARAERRHRRPA